MRYHIASLVSIFLALAIGILLGTVIQEKGVIEDRQQALVKRLQEDYTSLREENLESKQQLQLSQRFSTEVMPYLTENKLSGKNFVIFAIGDLDRETKKQVLSSIVQAGAIVKSITTFFPRGTDIDQAFASLRRYQTGSISPGDEEYRQAIITTVVKQLTSTTPPTIVKKLNQSGVIESTGNYKSKINGILFYVSQTSDIKTKEISQLLAAMKKTKIPVVGIERSDSGGKAVKVCQDAGFSSVDNVETVPGQIALIAVLKGANGNFGVKEAGRQLLPSLSP